MLAGRRRVGPDNSIGFPMFSIVPAVATWNAWESLVDFLFLSLSVAGPKILTFVVSEAVILGVDHLFLSIRCLLFSSGIWPSRLHWSSAKHCECITRLASTIPISVSPAVTRFGTGNPSRWIPKTW